MAVFTNVAGLNVREVLASRIDSVVTADAIIRDAGMVEIRWQPTDR